MNYGEVLARAWKIFWKFKLLWLFGIIPLLIYVLFFLVGLAFSPLSPFRTGPLLTSGVDWPGMEYLTVAITIWFLPLYAIATILGTTALVIGAYRAEGGAEKLSFIGLLRDSLPFFFRVLGLNCLFVAGLLVLFSLIMGCMLLATIGTVGYASICALPFFFLMIPIELIGLALLEQAKVALVMNNAGILSGLRLGWDVLKKNFWRIVLMGLILYGGTYILSMVAASPVYLVMFLAMGSSLNSQANFEGIFSTMMIIMMVVMPVYVLFSGVVLTYVRTAWTVTYLRLSTPQAASAPIPPVNA